MRRLFGAVSQSAPRPMRITALGDIDDVPCKLPERWVNRTMSRRYVPLFWVIPVVSSGSW